MAMNKTRWGNAIAAAVKSVGITAGAKITDAQLEQIWQAVAQEDKTEINNNADIQLMAGDLQVPGSGLSNAGGPVTGTANNAAMTPATARIK